MFQLGVVEVFIGPTQKFSIFFVLVFGELGGLFFPISLALLSSQIGL